MNFPTIILAAALKAKVPGALKAKVPGALLVAICAHESMNFHLSYNPDDKGTPSYGICQVKEDTAKMFGFDGDPKTLNNPKESAKYAARYLRFQVRRYGDDWCKLTAAYNAGTYKENKRHPGRPRNIGYVQEVQKKLAEDLRPKLSCEEVEKK